MAFQKAVKSQAKLRLALAGLAGRGKTYSALAIATTIAAEMRRLGHGQGRIALLDTEHESASLYADHFDFDTMPLDNHSPRLYVDAIREAESAGYDILIIDSLSHAWSGKNGALEQKDSAAARGGNSWTAWRDITPMHNALVDGMLSCRMHLVATLRQKMEYIQTNEGGKTKIEKVGLASIQREGMEYEFTIFGDMDDGHVMRIAKHRMPGVLNVGDAFERPGEMFAKKVYGSLMSGAALVPRAAAPAPISVDNAVVGALHAIDAAPSLADLEALVPRLRELSGAALAEGRAKYVARKDWLTRQLVKSVPTSAGSSSEPMTSQSNSETPSDASTGDAPAPEAA